MLPGPSAPASESRPGRRVLLEQTACLRLQNAQQESDMQIAVQFLGLTFGQRPGASFAESSFTRSSSLEGHFHRYK